MSVERALIARAQSQLLTARARSIIEAEAVKGCTPDISRSPIPLEPPFYLLQPDGQVAIASPEKSEHETADANRYTLGRHRVWISPNQPFCWTRAELFLKIIKCLRFPAGFEICGNCDDVRIHFLIHQADEVLVRTAFKSQFEFCELTQDEQIALENYDLSAWKKVIIRDFYPLPPYSHLFTQIDELKISPLDPLFVSLISVPSSAFGFFQVLFQGTAPNHNWHQNINVLLDLEYRVRLLSGMLPWSRTPVQSPSSELKNVAFDNEQKAHNDKPFFAAVMRMGVIGDAENNDLHLQRLEGFANIFQHGGRPFCAITQNDYFKVLDAEAVRSMIVNGTTHRHGFILNSSELCGIVHPPPADTLKNRPEIVLLETLPVRGDRLLAGTPVGISNYAGKKQIVYIPPILRSQSTHLLSRNGMGKSTVIEHMGLHDIANGAGIAVLDPHGDLIQRFLHLIPRSSADRVIYFFPGDSSWVPLWNPIEARPKQDISRIADDIVASIKGIVQGWGDRLENLLRHAIYALLLVPGSSFLDVANLLRKDSNESKALLLEIDRVSENQISRNFWQSDFKKYTNQDLTPPQHKLSKLLMSGTVAMMLSQPENRIDFREIMDTGRILLVDLSGLGSEVRELLGSFILSLLYITAMSRSDIPIDQRKPFHIYCDEAHRFLTDSIEDLITETRKYGVSLTLAHQYLRQFDQKRRDAILGTGSTVIFNVDLNDARYLVKDLRELVKPEEIASFEVGEAVARIGTDIVKIRTKPPLPLPADNCCQYIIENSHQLYYQPLSEVKERLTNRRSYNNAQSLGYGPLQPDGTHQDTGEEFQYEEFE